MSLILPYLKGLMSVLSIFVLIVSLVLTSLLFAIGCLFGSIVSLEEHLAQ